MHSTKRKTTWMARLGWAACVALVLQQVWLLAHLTQSEHFLWPSLDGVLHAEGSEPHAHAHHHGHWHVPASAPDAQAPAPEEESDDHEPHPAEDHYEQQPDPGLPPEWTDAPLSLVAQTLIELPAPRALRTLPGLRALAPRAPPDARLGPPRAPP